MSSTLSCAGEAHALRAGVALAVTSLSGLIGKHTPRHGRLRCAAEHGAPHLEVLEQETRQLHLSVACKRRLHPGHPKFKDDQRGEPQLYDFVVPQRRELLQQGRVRQVAHAAEHHLVRALSRAVMSAGRRIQSKTRGLVQRRRMLTACSQRQTPSLCTGSQCIGDVLPAHGSDVAIAMCTRARARMDKRTLACTARTYAAGVIYRDGRNSSREEGARTLYLSVGSQVYSCAATNARPPSATKRLRMPGLWLWAHHRVVAARCNVWADDVCARFFSRVVRPGAWAPLASGPLGHVGQPLHVATHVLLPGLEEDAPDLHRADTGAVRQSSIMELVRAGVRLRVRYAGRAGHLLAHAHVNSSRA